MISSIRSFTLLKRCLGLSSGRYLPRSKPRSSVAPVAEDDEADPNATSGEPDVGMLVYDNERLRTADPTVQEKKRPKKTVEDIINATRKMRANYFQKAAKETQDESRVNHTPPAVDDDDGDFFGIPSSSIDPPLKVLSDKKIASEKPIYIEKSGHSQYIENFEVEEQAAQDQLVNQQPTEDLTVKPRQQIEAVDDKKLSKSAELSIKKKIRVPMEEARDEEEEGEKETYAFKVAMEIRRSLEGRDNIAKDSKGFRMMTGQPLNWEAMTPSEMFNLIRKAIVYNADDIIAVNKPYGLSCQGGPGTRVSLATSFNSLANWLEKLQKGNGRPQTEKKESEEDQEEKIWCRLVHRLDRDTTGVILIATKQAVTAKLRFWFNERKVKKVYWTITKFVPKEPEGVIDIPMYECELSRGVYRMNLVPAIEASRKHGAVRAVTRYKVIDAHDSSAALIECYPETGVKHQLRCHLGLGLATPILGDHKYSYADSIKPQRLPPSVLTALEMRQAKARSVPLHLHAARLILPEFQDGRTIVIAAKPPQFFIDTARRLKLKLPHF